MKIIMRGKLPQNETFQIICGNCKTVFQFTKGEAKSMSADVRENVTYWYVSCPVCGDNCSATKADIVHDASAEDFYNK